MYPPELTTKMKAFIQRLTANPSLAKESKLTIEENIILFFTQNQNALKTTFSSPSFFPNLGWNDVQKLFQETLFDEINVVLLPAVKNIIEKRINYQFLNTILNRQLPVQNFQKEVIDFFDKIHNVFEVRRNLEGFLKLVQYGIIDKYMKQIFEQKAYIAREFNIVEKLKLNNDMVGEYIKFITLISLLGFIRSDLTDAPLQQKISARHKTIGNYYTQKVYFEKIIRQFTTSLNILTDDTVKKCVSFHLNFQDDKTLPATSRFSKIMLLLAKNYRPQTRVDKGADTYEKSWFQAQRKNYKFFGFDIDMINELYRISAENYW